MICRITTLARHAATVLLLTVCAAVAGCHTKETVGNDATVLGTTHVCSSCHGLQGYSENPEFPILAGQQHDYLVAQLKSFRDKTRADPHAHTYMWGMAAKLNDTTIDGLATYFSQQPAASPQTGDPALVSAGAAIFKNGITATNVPACAACHGDSAGGNGAIPRLASQHTRYLAEQLAAFKTNSRANEMMHANAEHLTPQEIAEVTAYLGSL